MRARGWAPVVLVVGVLGLSATVQARDNPANAGSAIVPAFTLRSEVHVAGGSARLVGCVTNENPSSSRELATGDRFVFTLGFGDFQACNGVAIHSPVSDFVPGDFTCAVDGADLTLTFVAPAKRWMPGDAICATVEATLPDASLTVRCRHDVRNEGAVAPPAPHYFVLNVGDGLVPIGPPGPVGPSGPTGPEGPPGASASGAHVMVSSTEEITASGSALATPILVPGLSATVTIGASSVLSVQVDGISHSCSDALGHPRASGRILLFIDGSVVAMRDLGSGPIAGAISDVRLQLSLAYLSVPLAAGSHAVEVRLQNTTGGDTRTLCVGSFNNDGLQARLIIVELRP